MKFPSWAPQDLVGKYKELTPKAAAEASRAKDLQLYEPRKALEDGDLHIGISFLGHQSELRILKPLLTNPEMARVWHSLTRRAKEYSPVSSFPYGSREQGGNLFGACMNIELAWLNLPLRTKAESVRYYESVADLALRLMELLLKDVHDPELLDTRRYITEEKLKAFKRGLEKDDHEIWYGFDGYLDYLLGDLLEPVTADCKLTHYCRLRFDPPLV